MTSYKHFLCIASGV